MQIIAGIEIAVLKRGHSVEAWLKIWPVLFFSLCIYYLKPNFVISGPTLTLDTSKVLLEMVYITGPMKNWTDPKCQLI